jgi:hypothetical protein
MIRIVKRLPFALLIAGTLAAGAGCYGTVGYATPGADVYVETAPPAPRVEYYDTRPGYVWIGGNWNWSGGQWVWGPGRYERERVGYDYEPGRWEPRGGRYVWVGGRWNEGRGHGPVVRDAGPGVRDHRTETVREVGPAPGNSRDHRSSAPPPPPVERNPRDHRHP